MNLVGLQTLFMKETRRFLRVPAQTVAQPVVTTTLYFLVFGTALGGRLREFEGVPYTRFIMPGLVMLALIQNAFLNTSSSVFVSKIQGTIVDLLMAPLGPGEIVAAYTGAGVVRGLLVGSLTWLVAAVFSGFGVHSVAWVLLFAVLVSATFALLGLVVAIWSDKFEQLNLVPTFVITPLTFLGGVFYSVRLLPSPWSEIARANPVLYMVEGLRYGLVGASAASPWLGLGITGAMFGVSLGLAWWMLATGYKLRN